MITYISIYAIDRESILDFLNKNLKPFTQFYDDFDAVFHQSLQDGDDT